MLTSFLTTSFPLDPSLPNLFPSFLPFPLLPSLYYIITKHTLEHKRVKHRSNYCTATPLTSQEHIPCLVVSVSAGKADPLTSRNALLTHLLPFEVMSLFPLFHLLYGGHSTPLHQNTELQTPFTLCDLTLNSLSSSCKTLWDKFTTPATNTQRYVARLKN